jgi:hypothetical protein
MRVEIRSVGAAEMERIDLLGWARRGNPKKNVGKVYNSKRFHVSMRMVAMMEVVRPFVDTSYI